MCSSRQAAQALDERISSVLITDSGLQSDSSEDERLPPTPIARSKCSCGRYPWKRPEPGSRSLVTEEDIEELTVDVDSEVEDSLGPNFYLLEDGSNMHPLSQDYEGDPEEFRHYIESAKKTWTKEQRLDMFIFLEENGVQAFLNKYILELQLSVEKLLYAMGVLLSREARQLDDEALLPMLTAALIRKLRRCRRRNCIESIDGIIQVIQASRHIVVLTGAGVSCGIPDFRSRDGLYAQLSSSSTYDLSDPQEMFDIDYFKHNPQGLQKVILCNLCFSSERMPS